MASTHLIIHTSLGQIKISLDHDHTPITSQNFIAYANQGFYDGTLFHRVINNFMIQGGGLTPGMEDKKSTIPPIKNEANKARKNKRGTLAMARTSDPHSATSQFFINVVDNPFLDFTAETPQGWGYCVFGHVIEGMDIVDTIKAVKTTMRRGHQDVPVDEILIEKVELDANDQS
ncbi:MAG: peptidyl-prolyl cis-trans isomerase [Gammaproteobacteria bacterium]|nr:peptidyl-prolyl cis-trans isomerase [Gammaproteobacteria bacterium]MCD8542272.1 peptidyl-prolyl cis-trans isomerase [Gammaproteobacteria bacterium]MCD8573760.1 peptidyl-prolyl cis-trans isomerase [Gammaproteobacteria bacterium]